MSVRSAMQDLNGIVDMLKASHVTVSRGKWLSDGVNGWMQGEDGTLVPKSSASCGMVKVAALVASAPPHPSVHDHRKRKMHVHIGGPRRGLSEVTVVEITPHGVVRNRFYRVKCDEPGVYRRLSSLAKIRSWGNLFKMITALRHLI